MEKVLWSFVAELFARVDIPMHTVTLPCGDLTWMDLGFRKSIPVSYERLARRIEEMEGATVYHITDLFRCSYTAFRLPEGGEYVFLGPVLFERMTERRVDRLFQTLKLPDSLRGPLEDYYSGIRFMPDQGSYEGLVTLTADSIWGKGGYSVVYEDPSFLDDAVQVYNNHLRIPDQPFRSIRHVETRYAMENLLMAAVADGNESLAVDYVSKLENALFPQRLASELRDKKDLCITVNTLLRKAAEQAGVHPIHIDSCSNRNVQLVEQMTSAEQTKAVVRKLTLGYCRLVQEHNLRAYPLPIRKVITCISTDLTADLSLKSLALQINVNASYLSSLFKKEMGMPLTEYVNRCRVSHAQLLLLTTELPIKAIAKECGISDMQYFSRMFKRITGVTPKVYQETAAYEPNYRFSKP